MKIHPCKRIAASLLAVGMINQPLWGQTPETAPTQAPPATQSAEPTTTPPVDQPTDAPKPDANGSQPQAAPTAPAAPASKPAPNEKKLEKIIVTGTRIKRVDIEGTTPVTAIKAEEMTKTGSPSVVETLRQSASAPTGVFTGEGGFVRSGASTIDLLGIGSGRTLVLLDGKRLPPQSSLGGAVNIDNIPTAMIDRIEILSGGASAVYGADAVGGVVNIITKKKFEGNEAALYRSVTQHGGGDVTELSVTNGTKVGENLHIITSIGAKTRNEVWEKNRDISQGEFPRDYTAGLAPAGTWSYRTLDATTGARTSDFQPSPNCPAENRKNTVPTLPDTYCAGKRADTPSWLSPQEKEWYAFNRIHYEINDNLNFSSTLLYDEVRSHYVMGNYLTNTTDPIQGTGVLLSAAKARELGMTDVQDGQIVELNAKTLEMPLRENDNFDRTYGGTLMLEGEAGDDWSWNSSLTHYVAENQRFFNNILDKSAQTSLFHGTWETDGSFTNKIDPDFIPIDPNRNVALLDGIHADLKTSEVNRLTLWDVYGSRDLVPLPGGMLSWGIGGSYATESYEQSPDQRDREFFQGEPRYEGTASVSGKGKRHVSSVYTEMVAPIIKNVEVDGALRFDQYDDFGSTTNYGLGAKYSPFANLAFRAHMASSFKAPILADVHQEGGGGYRSVADEKWCQQERDRGNVCEPGGSHQIYVDGPGNKNLKEEKGKSYTVGFIVEPIPEFSLTTDYHAISMTGTHGTDAPQEILDDYYAGKDIGDNRVTVDPDGVITSMALPTQNRGTMSVYAVDVNGDLNLRFADDYRMGWNSRVFRYISYKVQERAATETKAASDEREIAGLKGAPKYRWTNSFSFGTSVHTGTLTSSTTGKQSQDPEDIVQNREYHSVGQYTEYNAAYDWKTPWNGGLTLGVNNLFDTIGGKDTSGNILKNETVDLSLYSARGRSYFAKITQKF